MTPAAMDDLKKRIELSTKLAAFTPAEREYLLLALERSRCFDTITNGLRGLGVSCRDLANMIDGIKPDGMKP